ncbi:MAG: zinc ribbon domain-containing protein [Ignisphaera sp.]
MSQSFRCSNCGAPLDVSPETIAVVCSYCGYLNWIREDLKEEILVVKPLGEREILKKIEAFGSRKKLGQVFKETNLSKLTLVLVPFYLVDVSAQADYNANVVVSIRKCRREKNEERCWTESRNVFVKGVYGSYNDIVPVAGRRGSNVLSVRVLGKKYAVSRVEAVPLGEAKLDKNVWRGILSIEVDKKTAMDIALNEHLNRLRSIVTEVIKREAESRVRMRGEHVVGSTILWKRITPINVKAATSKPTLLPMYTAVYMYGGGIYRVILCGWDGETIAFERPMRMSERIAWGTLSAIASGVLGGLSGMLIMANPIASLPLLVIGGVASWYCMKKALTPVKTTVVEPSLRNLLNLGLAIHGISSILGEIL